MASLVSAPTRVAWGDGQAPWGGLGPDGHGSALGYPSRSYHNHLPALPSLVGVRAKSLGTHRVSEQPLPGKCLAHGFELRAASTVACWLGVLEGWEEGS